MARTLVRRDRRRAPADRRSGRNAPLPGAPQPDIAFGTLGPLSPEEKFELHKHLVEPGGVSPGAEQFELSRLAIEARLGAADEPVAGQERQDVVAVLALRRRDVHLQSVVEVEERLGAIAVVHEAVERRQQRRPVGHRRVARVRVGVPLPLLQADTEGPEALLGEDLLGVAQRHRFGLRIPAAGEVPEPLAVSAPHDRERPALVKYLQHHPYLAASEPPVVACPPAAAVLQLATEQRPPLLELPQHVAAKACVPLQEIARPALPRRCVGAAVSPHPRADQRQRLDRPDERVPLEQLPLDPQQPVELAGVIATEPAPEDELLRGRHRGDRIELKEAEPPYGLEHPARRAVEELGPDGDSPRLLQRDSSSPAGHGDIISDQSRWARAEPRFIHTSVPRGWSTLGS